MSDLPLRPITDTIIKDVLGYEPVSDIGFSALDAAVERLNNLSIPTRAALAERTIPAGENRVSILRWDADSDFAPAVYRRVGSEPTHELKAQDQSGQWWEFANEIISPKMCGGRYNYTVGTRLTAFDNTDAFNRMFAYVRIVMTANTHAYPRIVLGQGVCLIAGSVNATSIRQGLTWRIDGYGCTVVGRGAGNVTLDFIGSRHCLIEGLYIVGETQDPPDIGLLMGRRQASESSDYMRLINCATHHSFRFAGFVNLNSEEFYELGCHWRNIVDASNPANVAAADGEVYGAVFLSHYIFTDIIQSAYETITLNPGERQPFIQASHIRCSYTLGPNNNGHALLMSSMSDHAFYQGYITAQKGTRLLFGDYPTMNVQFELHVEGGGNEHSASYMTIEPMVNPVTETYFRTDCVFNNCVFRENAARGNTGFFVLHPDVTAVEFRGGSIEIGRAALDLPRHSLFSHPEKAHLYNDLFVGNAPASRNAEEVLGPVARLPNKRVLGSRVLNHGNAVRGVMEPETYEILQWTDVAPGRARTQALDDLVRAWKAAGFWQKVGFIYVFAARDAQSARLNWRRPGFRTATLEGSPAFAVNQGYTFSDSVLQRVDTLHPLNGIPGYTQNAAHVGVWIHTAGSEMNPILGFSGASPLITFNPRNSSDQFQARINAGSGGGIFGASLSRQGYFVANRTTSTLTTGYKNGASVGTNPLASGSLDSQSGTLAVGPLAGNVLANDQVSLFHAGASLTVQEIASAYAAFDAYLTAIAAL